MARLINRLTARTVAAKSKPGYYADGAGLYLQVSASGSKSWLLRFMLNGRAREMGLGSAHAVTLEAAREKAAACRVLLDQGKDPIEERAREDAQRRLEAAKAKTFDECAKAYIEAHRPSWRNAKHGNQWENTLATYASPTFGGMPVQAVDTALVMRVLDPIWNTKTETATRLRGRIESVLDWATVRGYRQGENPARWRGHLDKLLPKRSKVAPPQHHPALPYAQIPDFMRRLRGHRGIAVEALEFVILTVARVSEAAGATWAEVDFDQRLWTIPAARMKGHRPHRVPLSFASLKVLERMKMVKQTEFIFPGMRVGRHLTTAACLNLLHDMGHEDLTVHGFRSSFRDWASEQTAFPREVAEAALAHVVKDKAEAAYARSDLLEKRAKLMQAWADYCASKAM